MKIRTALIAGAAALVASSAATAGDLTLTFNGVSPSAKIQYSLNGAALKTTTAGRFNWTAANGQTVHTFCTQLLEGISSGQVVDFQMVPTEDVPDAPPSTPMGTAAAGVMQDLYRRFHSAAVFGGAVQAAAFQMLVWEISHEAPGTPGTDFAAYWAGLSMTSGNFNVVADGSDANSQPAIDLAIQWLGELGGATNDNFLEMAALQGLTDPTTQDQLIVPLPAPAMLAGIGLIGMVLVRRRMKS